MLDVPFLLYDSRWRRALDDTSAFYLASSLGKMVDSPHKLVNTASCREFSQGVVEGIEGEVNIFVTVL